MTSKCTPSQVRLLSAIAWIILLIACVNFMNLATASSQKRAREVGVRKMLGAERKRLITQFMSEGFFMSLMAAVVAIIIMAVSLPAFNLLMQKRLALNIANLFHVISLLIIAIICGLIFRAFSH